jgi:hypothetical protein
MKQKPSLEPFEPHILVAIRTAFQAGWSELSREFAADVTRLRNRLIGTIANLASQGVLDPHELKNRAFQALSIGPSESARGMCNAAPDG